MGILAIAFAFGFTLMVLVYAIGPAILQGETALANVWVFILAPIIGGLIGYALYRFTSKSDAE